MNAHSRGFLPALPDASDAERGRCTIGDCSRSPVAHGWCMTHYMRWKRHGDPTGGRNSCEAQTFYREVVLPYEGDDCLIWPFARTDNGYAKMGKTIRVSRRLCEEFHGKPPTPHHEAAHSCGKGRDGCVTRRHLSWKTKAENEADKVQHGTSNRGERQGQSKLTEAQVRAIRQMYPDASQQSIADLYGVSQPIISRIISREIWGWLE